MALESETGIGLRHTTAVVDDLNAGTSSIYHHDIDGVCSGIHSILYQLLDDRGWSLYHLSSSYLVGNTVW